VRSTDSGIEITPIYHEDDVQSLDLAERLGEPGEYPFTRGPYRTMYRERPWTMRQYAGFATAEETNERFRYLLANGAPGLSMAFDLPTQLGMDSDDPRALGEVGRVGVAIDSLDDMLRVFQDIPLDEVSTSMTINAPAAVVDGNAVRILARLNADATAYRDSSHAATAFTPLADALLSPARPGDYNQAVMELGATVCHRRTPLCTICPARPYCAASARGEPEAYPRLAAKLIEKKTVPRAWCERDGALLLRRGEAGAKRLADLHELPTAADLGLEPRRVDPRHLHRPEAAGVEDDHREPCAVDEKILPTEAPIHLIDAERIAQKHDIVGFVVFGKAGCHFEEIFFENSLRRSVAKIVLSVSPHPREVAVDWPQPRGDAPDHCEDRHECGAENLTVEADAHLKVFV
jgi:hypothetical protein